MAAEKPLAGTALRRPSSQQLVFQLTGPLCHLHAHGLPHEQTWAALWTALSTSYALTCQTAGLAEPDMEEDDAHEVLEAEEEVDIDNDEETGRLLA